MAQVRKYWYADNVFKSIFANSISITIPAAERFFVAAIKKAYPLVKDDALRVEVDTLFHEEDAHSKVHDRYNEITKRHGFKIDGFERFAEGIAGYFAKHGSLKTQIAICVATEYFTSLMAMHTLENGTFDRPGVDDLMRRIWVWHSLEELDHRATAFELYKYIGGGYLRRTFVMLWLATIFFSVHLAELFSLLSQDKVLWKWSTWKDAAGFLLGKDGFYVAVFVGWFRFFSPSFHPKKAIFVKKEIDVELKHFHIEDFLTKSLV